MKLNIENCAKNGSEGTKAWALDELVPNLKEMRDRSNAGDMQAAVTEFFEVFRFNDNQMDPSPIRAAVEAAQPEAVGWVGMPTVEELAGKIASMLHGTYHCTRVWNAWNVGTMSQDDFEPLDESETPTEIAAEIHAMLASAPTPTESQPAEADERIGLEPNYTEGQP